MTTIYALQCRVNGFAYIGSTKDTRKRFREHRCLLRNGKHQEPKLQQDWHDLGEDAFEMVDLESLPSDCPLELKREVELRWMRRYQSSGLYNRNIVAYGPTQETLRRGHAPSARRKAGATQRGRPKPPGTGAKISATKRRLGQKPSLEAAIAGNKACLKKRYGWSETG